METSRFLRLRRTSGGHVPTEGCSLVYLDTVRNMHIVSDVGGGVLEENILPVWPSQYLAIYVSTDSQYIDWELGAYIRLTLGANTTVSFSTPVCSGNYVLEVRQDEVGGRQLTLPVGTLCQSGLPPTLSAAAGALDLLSLFYDGTGWRVLVVNDLRAPA